MMVGARTTDLAIDFGLINNDNIEQLKKINQACFPVAYADTFYTDMANNAKGVKQDENLCKFAYCNGFAVGAICTRIENIADTINPTTTTTTTTLSGTTQRQCLYIMTLGVLAPYRNHGIGTKLVQSVIDYIQNEKVTPTSGKKINTIDEIKLHVQTSNTDAIQFYCTKFGFEKGELIENYYKRIDPPHCYILRKKL
jgi:ribosomal protein S18 acetylase RimI-like enzyme